MVPEIKKKKKFSLVAELLHLIKFELTAIKEDHHIIPMFVGAMQLEPLPVAPDIFFQTLFIRLKFQRKYSTQSF